MSKGFRGLTYAVLSAAGLFLMSAAPASAFCTVKSTIYNTGTLVGTGNSCSQARAYLQANLQSTASFNCQAIYGANADVYLSYYFETLNGCEQNGLNFREFGSASYKCVVCTP